MAFLDWLCESANNQAPSYRKNDAGRELVEYLQEYSGLSLTTDNSHELALWLHGLPGCGKSTFIEGFLAAMGDRTIEIGLGDIERSRFAIGDLPGKTLAIATEQPGDFVRSTDLLIKLISGELVTVIRAPILVSINRETAMGDERSTSNRQPWQRVISARESD